MRCNQARNNYRSQLGRDPNRRAEPGLKSGPALMKQHAEAIDDGVPAFASGDEKFGFERHVDDVDNRRRLRQTRNIEDERRLSDHAEARGVDEKASIAL